MTALISPRVPIPTRPVLEFLDRLNGQWGTWFVDRDGVPFENSVIRAMPEGVHPRRVQAKMRKLGKRGLIDGCFCGCRGDYELTEAGRIWLSDPTHQE